MNSSGLMVQERPYSGRSVIAFFMILLGLFAGASTARAQADGLGGFNEFGALPGMDNFGGLGNDDPISVSASFQMGESSDQGRLSISVTLADQWHIYSLTQQPGGPTKTTLKLAGPDSVELLGPFTADQTPKSNVSTVWEGVTVEEHSGQFKWTAPIKVADPASAKDLKIDVSIDGLTCREGEGGGCIPYSETVEATYDGSYEIPKPTGEFRNPNSVVLWKGSLQPATVAAGETVQLRLTAVPDEGFHVYRVATTSEMNATNLVLTQLAGFTALAPRASSEPITKEGIAGAPAVSYHEGTVQWTVDIVVPEDAEPGQRTIAGLVGYQACTETNCRLPMAVEFTGTVTVSDATAVAGNDATADAADNANPLAFAKAKHAAVLEAADTIDWVTEPKQPAGANVDPASQSSLGVILGMALIGGLILNLMPCVLPVVGLKLMALVESAGEDQSKVLSHNLWYSFGLLSVFWILAAIAITLKLMYGQSFSWGQQFTFFEFRLALTLLVFVMALSFLGVWEIPLPGFASGKASQQLQKKEGPAGAFFKGVFTTLLATPCSGPLLGVVFGFTLASAPWVTFLVFSTVGLGMALPYILIGLVPQAVFWLPKPGAWMETLKQLMAFVLLGTVAFLFAGFSEVHKVPVFVTLIGSWFACWWIGRVPLWDTLQKRLTAWSGGLVSAAVVGFLAFRLLTPGEEVMQWQPYSEPKLAQLQSEGKTVMVDFTAKWCVNCIVNYNRALNTEETAELMKKLDAVPMLADWTDRNAEIAGKLNELQSASIPVLAIYPGGDPNNPIILRDLVSQGQVLEALKEAGPSVSPDKAGAKVALRQ
jgi:thiol:disulfide interchange protein